MSGLIKEFMTENGKIVKCTEKVYLHGQMEENTLASL